MFCLSFSSRASSILRLPEQADDPKRLLPNRAPSSSAQSTRRTVTGGLPLYWALMRLRISTPARTLRQPSSQPPFGTESVWPPIRSELSDSPRKVVQRLTAASVWFSTESASSFFLSQVSVATQVLVKATRCAPFSSALNLLFNYTATT